MILSSFSVETREVVPLADPGAGNDAVYVVPTPNAPGALKLHAVRFSLTTDATVGDRTPIVNLREPGDTVDWASCPGRATPPSSSGSFLGLVGGPFLDQDPALFPLPDFPLSPGATITVTLSGAGSADTLTDIRLAVARLGLTG